MNIFCSVSMLTLVFLLCSSKVANSATLAHSQIFRVNYVYDGDTLDVSSASNPSLTYKVRLVCIDAPEKAQRQWGIASTNQLK